MQAPEGRASPLGMVASFARVAGLDRLALPDRTPRTHQVTPAVHGQRARSEYALAAMDARPQLERIAAALAAAKLECILIGNAAAALHGAPVTTLAFDFLFRNTPHDRRKVIHFARALGAIVLRPYYPASSMLRVTDEDLTIQADFLGTIHGIRSFEGARRRALTVEIGGFALRVLALEDIVKSKTAANRPKDRAVLPVLRATLRAKAPKKK